MIRDLGDPEYETRESASRALAELGYLAKFPMDVAFRRVSDPEVRRRLRKLLDELKD